MALDALQSTPLASLPVIVRFLFQAADDSNAAEVRSSSTRARARAGERVSLSACPCRS